MEVLPTVEVLSIVEFLSTVKGFSVVCSRLFTCHTHLSLLAYASVYPALAHQNYLTVTTDTLVLQSPKLPIL
jgi:hypothetical protein